MSKKLISHQRVLHSMKLTFQEDYWKMMTLHENTIIMMLHLKFSAIPRYDTSQKLLIQARKSKRS